MIIKACPGGCSIVGGGGNNKSLPWGVLDFLSRE